MAGKALIYGRVSQKKGRSGESFISPQDQENEGRRWAKAYGHDVVDVLMEMDKSGGTIDRPKFQRALAMAEAGEANFFVVSKLDRFARTVPGAHEAIARLKAAGCHFVSVADGFDLSKPSGQLQFDMLAAIAAFELARLREGWSKTVVDAIERGVHPAGTAPGYTRGKDKRFRRDALAPFVHRAFEMRADAEPISHIVQVLNQDAPLEDGRLWTYQRVTHMLSNRVYLGEVFYGDLRKTDAHEPIVTEDEYRRAQLARGPARPTTSTNPAILAGLVRCAGCRYCMAQGMGGKANDYALYRCKRKHAHGRCPEPTTISREALEEWALEQLRARVAQLEVIGTPANNDGTELRASDARTRDEYVFWRDNTELRDGLGDSEYTAGLLARKRAWDEAQDALQAWESSRGSSGLELSDALAAFDALPFEARKRVLGAAIDAIFIRRGRLRAPIEERALILWRGEGPDDLPVGGKGKHNPIRPFAWPDDPVEGGALAA